MGALKSKQKKEGKDDLKGRASGSIMNLVLLGSGGLKFFFFINLF